MILRSLILVVGLSASFCVSAEEISLSAHPGEFNVKTLGPASSRSSLSVSLHLVEFKNTQEWPTAAYAGFFQGQNRDNSVQFVLIRNKVTDAYIVAGYRVIENGREAKVKSITTLPLESTVNVFLGFKDGVTTIKLDGKHTAFVRTSLKKVSPYVSVSSGTAEFNVGP
jgi:hypothetical protein